MSIPTIGTATDEHIPGGRLIPAPFIIGAGRSGTTLLKTMLVAHPDLAIPPETHFIGRLVRKCDAVDNPRDCFLETVTSSPHWPRFRLDRVLLEERIAGIVPFDLTEALRAFYKLYAEPLGKPRWGDKTPRYATKMRLIQRVLPEAHFIHIIRDGRDVALSVLEEHWGPTTIEEAAQWWVTRIRQGQYQAKEAHAYMELHYEDLVRETQPTLQRICDFIDLPWNDQMLGYYNRRPKRMEVEERRDKTPRRHWTPPDPSRIGRWRTQMSTSDRQSFEAVAGKLLRRLGYEVG